MEVSYATMEAMGMLIQLLGQDARRLEKALAKTMNASAEWKRIADELKAERDAAKQEAVSARQDAVTRAEADRKRIDGLMIQAQDMRAEIERLKKPRQHPVKAGEYVRRLTGFNTTPAGEIAQVIRVHIGAESNSYEYEILRPNGQPGAWVSKNCTPCDPPEPAVEASHDTPEGLKTAEGAVMPKPGDVVRLVRVPTNDEYPHDSGRWEPNWGGIGDYMRVHYVGSNINGTRVVRAVFGLEWPLSCVEVVKGGE